MRPEQYLSIINNSHYQNPILFGDYADPSILKDGKDYYLVHSVCGEHQRLMPMWHSNDLIHWELLYHVFEGCHYPQKKRDMLIAWAPELIKVENTYYIYNYTPDFGTWVTICDDIKKGNWSMPHEIVGVEGIDPGHVVDENGNRFLCMSRNLLYPLSRDGLSITGPAKKICDYWPIPNEFDIEGICTESPKFFKKGEYWYLLTAQGGTMGPPTSHCVVAYRAKNPAGPYEISPYNPIIHTQSKNHTWWSTGHGSLVEGPDKKTYILYHGIRNAHRYLGRQTLMMPVTWTKDDWFIVSEKDDCPQQLPKFTQYPCNIGSMQKLSVSPSDKKLGLLYNYDDRSVQSRIIFEPSYIRYYCSPGAPWDTKAITFMPQGYSYEYAVTLNWEHTNAGFGVGFRFTTAINCGITIHRNCISLFKHGQYEWLEDSLSAPESIITLKMKCLHGTVSFWVQIENEKEYKFPHAYDIADWNPNVTRGFSYVNPCLWAFGEGEVSISKIEYINLDT